MFVAIHSRVRGPDDLADKWAEHLGRREVDVLRVDLTTEDVLQQLEGCDGIMWRWHSPRNDEMSSSMRSVLEFRLGMPVFPNHRSSWHRRNKLAQHDLLQAAGVPMPKTWIFRDRQRAKEWALHTDYPKVFKLSAGGSGRGVALISSAEQACRLVDRMFGVGLSSARTQHDDIESVAQNREGLRALIRRWKGAAHLLAQGRERKALPERGYVYFQEVVRGREFNVSVVGDRAFAFHKMRETEDFGSRRGTSEYDPSHIDVDCVRMAFDIHARCGFQIMAYDLVVGGGQTVVLEMNFKHKKTGGYWTRDLEWVSEPMSHEEAHVEAFLNSIRPAAARNRQALDRGRPLHRPDQRPAS